MKEMEKMKKICFAVFAFVIALAFAGAGEAAAPDAKVKGLWLKAPKFPADAEVAEFSYDKEMDIVEYARVLATALRFHQGKKVRPPPPANRGKRASVARRRSRFNRDVGQ